MRAGDLHRTGAKCRVRIVIGDDRDQTAVLFRADRNFAEFADDRRIAFITGMHRHRAVAQHCFGPRCGNRDIVTRLAKDDVSVFILFDIFVGLATGQRIFEVPHVAVNFGVLDFEIGDRRLELRVPVDQPLATIDQPFIVEPHEHFKHRLRQALIHGEAFARPVT